MTGVPFFITARTELNVNSDFQGFQRRRSANSYNFTQLQHTRHIFTVNQHNLQLVIQRLTDIHQHITTFIRRHAAHLDLNPVQRRQRFSLGQLFRLDIERHTRAKRRPVSETEKAR